jgi:GAF domain-containing protein
VVEGDQVIEHPGRLTDFQSASRSVLAFLRKRFGFGLWMVTRAEGDDWIVLQSEDSGGYGVGPGTVYRWEDTLCARMVAGDGPRIAPDANAVPAYASAPIRDRMPTGAYIGMPLLDADGKLFGTLCAVDREPQPESLKNDEELIEMLARLLALVLQQDLKVTAESRRIERLEAAAHLDALTQLYNRRAWELFIEREEERCIRYGHPAYVLSIDLDDLGSVNQRDGEPAGDRLLQRTSDALRGAARESDVVARLGGDEFGIIAV